MPRSLTLNLFTLGRHYATHARINHCMPNKSEYPQFIHTMSSTALIRAIRRLANPARPILTASASAPIPAAAATTPQSYIPRLPWPYTHNRSMHTHIPRSITYEVVGTYLGLWKQQTRAFTCSGLLQLKRTQYPSRPKVLEEDIEENFVKGRWVVFLFTPPPTLFLSLLFLF